MLDEYEVRVLLENSIRERVIAINKQDGDKSIECQGAIKVLQEVLEDDNFTIDILTHSIKAQEEKRGDSNGSN